jgi:hypothetical protein
MAKLKNGKNPPEANVFRFTLTGLIALCVCLSAGGLFLGAKISGARAHTTAGPMLQLPAPGEMDKFTFTRREPWGELLTQDISLERPVEHLNVEMKAVQPPVWTFQGKNPAQVQAFFIANGLTPPEAQKALAPPRVSTQGPNTAFQPSDEFLFSLRPETRTRLYDAMRGLDVNPYLEQPLCYSRKLLDSIYADTRLQAEDLALLKKLVCGGPEAWQFSDYETLMGKIPTVPRRVAMAASLSRQSAVLGGIRIRPDTDIDKVVLYWASQPNVRFMDIRPMCEALKRLPSGGALSWMYLLPPFVRERLYTYPLPAAPGEPVPDCNWSTFNFSSVRPDNRFLDPAECVRYLDQAFYKIAQPNVCGDVLLFRDKANRLRHSAVYLADDLVFTKIGKGPATPWMIARISDLQAMFSSCDIACFRSKAD